MFPPLLFGKWMFPLEEHTLANECCTCGTFGTFRYPTGPGVQGGRILPTMMMLQLFSFDAAD